MNKIRGIFNETFLLRNDTFERKLPKKNSFISYLMCIKLKYPYCTVGYMDMLFGELRYAKLTLHTRQQHSKSYKLDILWKISQISDLADVHEQR